MNEMVEKRCMADDKPNIKKITEFEEVRRSSYPGEWFSFFILIRQWSLLKNSASEAEC